MISMKTPIYDYVSKYIASGTSRLHMPGHKGVSFLGCESRDLTEITGADDLFHADGIIAESEANAASLFGTYRTFYSTEGSSHVIRAMLMLASGCFLRHQTGRRFTVFAARNVHKAFISACALLDLDVDWLYPDDTTAELSLKTESSSDAAGFRTMPASICSCRIKPRQLHAELSARSAAGCLPDAVYITSPDYLGNLSDVRGLSDVCRTYGLPLLVDNAHGAYLHFLNEPLHPIDLGAAMCCDSAHKTLPAITGGAYLHIAADMPGFSPEMPVRLASGARQALSVFGTSSPSYLVLQSLDLCNRYLSADYKKRLDETIQSVDHLKDTLRELFVPILETEPLKLVLGCAPLGLSGSDVSDILRKHMVECEFTDSEYVVLMFTPENRDKDYNRILAACRDIMHVSQRGKDHDTAISKEPVSLPVLERACPIREALLGPSRIIPAQEAEGEICAIPTVSCPPAIPIAVSGERFNAQAVRLLKRYGIDEVSVIADRV